MTFKLTVYNYDLVSGKVNQVSYQPGQADAFYHQYSYDAENRITSVRTSKDSFEWQNDASYTYYRHGPSARTEIGDLQLQGVDYAYIIQGWLKSINPSWVMPTGSTDQYDSDGVATPAHFERDAYKLNLNYFDDGTYTDFRPIAPNSGYVQGNGLASGAKRNLYNGNIGSMGIDIRALATSAVRDAGPMLYNYGYDQLNRITKMEAWNANGNLGPVGTVALTEYAERYGYDPNSNILTLNRNGDSAHTSMDQLSYKYVYAKTGGGTGEYVPGSAPTTGVDHLTNQLSSIQDAVTGNSYSGDIKTQAAFNYQYDAIGELTDDDTAKIHSITWNVYGKLLSLSDSGNTISYTYDAAGNRISKVAHGITTWYVRDAQGNVMSVYTQGNSAIHGDSLTQTEAHLYGSSRLGVLNLSVNCAGSLTPPTLRCLVRGKKLFELTNHLGNVLATITDKKVQHSSDSTTVAYYTADVINANDYYPFGMQMPVRSYAASTAGNYRYGFNGKEQDPEVKWAGDHYDYGMRMYDPRVGRFLSVDPLTSRYPSLSPYHFAENQPVWAVDLNGLEKYIVTNFVNRNNEIVSTTIEGIRSSDTKQAVNLQLKNAHGRPLTLQDVYVTKQLSDNPPQGSNATVQEVGGKTSLSRDEQRALNHSVSTATDENTSSSDLPFDNNLRYEFIFAGKGKYTSSYFDQSKNEFFAGALNFYYHTIEGTDLVGGNYDGSGRSRIDLTPTGVSNDVNALAELVQDSKTMIEKENPEINKKDQLDHVVLTTTTNAAPLINLVATGLQKKLGVPVTVVVDDTITPNGKPPGDANVNVRTAVRSVGNPNDNKSN